MGVVIGGQRGAVPPWIFVHDTDKVEGGLMVLCVSLVFSVAPLEIFLPTPLTALKRFNDIVTTTAVIVYLAVIAMFLLCVIAT